MHYNKNITCTGLFILLLCCTAKSYAQGDAEERGSAADLAKKLANPIANLISVPFQNNTNYGMGELKGTQNILNFQPVMPLSLNKNWNLITRWIFPFVMQYNLTDVAARQIGLSDAVISGFFSPKNTKNGITWGLGPVFQLPTGTNDYLTSKKFGIGPTGVILKQKKGWTVGLLVNQVWSVAGEEELPPVNQMFFQPFMTYNWKSGAGLGWTVEWTQNWQTSTTVMWLTPTVSGITSLGEQKVQLAVGPRINIDAPSEIVADLGWRAVIVLLFPQ
jgi:hypothetical protein